MKPTHSRPNWTAAPILVAGLLTVVGHVPVCQAETITANQPEYYRILNLPPEEAKNAEEPLKAAIDHFRAGKPDDCLASLEEAVGLAPGLPPADLMFARMFLHVGNDVQALRRLDRLAVERPDQPEVFVSLGELALRQGRLTDAWLQLERAETLKPPSTWNKERLRAFREELYQLQGQAAERREDQPAAERIFSAWSKLNPKSAPALLGLGRARLTADKTDEALALFRKAKDVDPKTPAAETLVALIHMSKGNAKLAEDWFQKAIAAKTVEPPARLDFARWLLRQDRPAEALIQLEAIPDDPETDNARLFLRGLAARCQGKLDEAEAAFAALQRDHPADWQVADQLALVLVEQRDEVKRVRAAQLSEANLRQSPDKATALATAGWVRLRLGDLTNAEKLLQQALQTAPPSPTTRYYVSRLLATQGRKPEAEKWMADAAEQPGLWVERRITRNTTPVKPSNEP
jgi:tetratricopeptide (TPR) repeat protein